MLILGRKVDQATILKLPDGRQIRVLVVDVRDGMDRVRLGFEAPADIQILREELETAK